MPYETTILAIILFTFTRLLKRLLKMMTFSVPPSSRSLHTPIPYVYSEVSNNTLATKQSLDSAQLWSDLAAVKRTKMTHGDIAPSLTTWDIDGGLAADFDGSLSGLGTELGTNTYNMSEALLALPVFKQENVEKGFQYVLGAATSPAIKLHEETVTYLNQGQSYEIKVKTVGDLSEYRGKTLKSVIKIQFQDRRLQYSESEHLERWRYDRPGERILDIDIPLSHGVIDVTFDPVRHNCATFVWDPTIESGIYIRVNCISTEFTPKKHGGEKGVSFRLEIKTFTNDTSSHLLHGAYCQIKVFKPKGADRKHRTDRERMEKMSGYEKEKFQPSYDCTVLTEIPLDTLLSPPSQRNHPNWTNFHPVIKDHHFGHSSKMSNSLSNLSISSNIPSLGTDHGGSPHSAVSPSSSYTHTPNESSSYLSHSPNTGLKSTSSAQEVTDWLKTYRFGDFIRVFQNFSGADLLRLSRDDLIQICGLADGIRLYNGMHAKALRPSLTIYVRQENDKVYHALYMMRPHLEELINKLAALCSLTDQQILEVYLQGPLSIHIIITDQVICNMKDQSTYTVEGVKDSSTDLYRLLLKPSDASGP